MSGRDRAVCLASSMDPEKGLRLYQQEDGDIIVSIGQANGRHMGAPSVEFCTPGTGGGRHERTWRALVALLRAMEEDEREENGGGA